MDQLAPSQVSPYRVFPAEEWARLGAGTLMTLTRHDVERLRSTGDKVDLGEVERVYPGVSRLLLAHVEASRVLFRERMDFLSAGADIRKTPFVIGIAGSVAVGKSTTARLLKELLARWPTAPKVALVTTDGFLYPNAVLEAEGLMKRKGFPESYDIGAILRFLSDVKAGVPRVEAPVYSHLVYDVVPNGRVAVEAPDILIFEGLNVLQVRDMPKDGKAIPFVSDFFDFSIYIDADESDIRRWYVERFMRLRDTAFRQEASYFRRYSLIGEGEAREVAETLWETINARNLRENILPTRPRADLILRKGPGHLTEQVALRKL